MSEAISQYPDPQLHFYIPSYPLTQPRSTRFPCIIMHMMLLTVDTRVIDLRGKLHVLSKFPLHALLSATSPPLSLRTIYVLL